MPYVDGFLDSRAEAQAATSTAGCPRGRQGLDGPRRARLPRMRGRRRQVRQDTPRFRSGVKLKKGEQVWFSWIVYRSRRDRDRVNATCHEGSAPRAHDGHARPCPSTASAWCTAASGCWSTSKQSLKTSRASHRVIKLKCPSGTLRTSCATKAQVRDRSCGSVFISDVHLGSTRLPRGPAARVPEVRRSRLPLPGR